MINVNVINGEVVGVASSNAPIPNRTASNITQSGNYGLADNARLLFKSMGVSRGLEEEKNVVMMGDEEEEKEVASAYYGGLARGRGKLPVRPHDPLPVPPPPPSISGSEHHSILPSSSDGGKGMDPVKSRTTSESTLEYETAAAAIEASLTSDASVQYVTECLFDRGEEVTASGLVDTFAKKNASRAVAGAVAKPSKANAYVMYLQHMRKTTGVTEPKTTDQLIKMFDKDWKALPEEERKEWKEKAKALRPASSQVESTAPTLVSSMRRVPKTGMKAQRGNAIARGLVNSGVIDEDDYDDADEW